MGGKELTLLDVLDLKTEESLMTEELINMNRIRIRKVFNNVKRILKFLRRLREGNLKDDFNSSFFNTNIKGFFESIDSKSQSIYPVSEIKEQTLKRALKSKIRHAFLFSIFKSS